MKFLLLLLLSPFAFAETPPTCSELGKILQNYEVDLQKKSLNECSKVDVKKDVVREASVADTDLISENVCSDLATIEAKLEKLKNEDAILSGIEKLKATIQASQAETADKNLPKAQEAGKKFVTSLNTAQSLELLVQSQTESGPLLVELKKIPLEKRKSSSDFKAAMKQICETRKNVEGIVDACDKSLFNPDEATINELNALIDNAQDVATQIPAWQNQLAIKRVKSGDSAYSFTQMRNEMESAFKKLDQGERLSRSELKVIQNLDQFENASGLSFVEHLSKVKNEYKSQFAVDRFRFLVEDSIQRQKHEMQSKTSQIWAGLDQSKLSGLDDSDRAMCNESKTSYEQALGCHHILKNKVDSTLKMDKQYNEFLSAMEASNNYINKLYGVSDDCLAKVQSGALQTTCMNEFTNNQAKVKDQILQLHLLKEKIGSENEEAMKWRNFALQKFGSMRCYQENSSIEFCDEENQTISPIANLLTDQVMNISVMYREAINKEDTDKQLAETSSAVENLCNDDERRKRSYEEKLCAFFNPTSTGPAIVTPERKEVRPPIAPESRPSTAVRDAWIAGANSIVNDLTNFYRNKMSTPLVNPYPYSGAYNGGAGPRGIADTIMFNARAYGAYGFYAPTPGFKPYTAFGASSSASLITPYSGVKSTPSTFFKF